MRRYLTLLFVLTTFFYLTHYATCQEIVPMYAEKYIIPSFTMYVVNDEREWNKLTHNYVGKHGNSVCGMHIGFDVNMQIDGKWKTVDHLHFVYVPKYEDSKIHTETIGHEVLHIVGKEYPNFKKFYNVDRYTNISAEECR